MKNHHFPFTHPLLCLGKSPGSDKRRVIVDLSWPKEGSINSTVKEKTYVGLDYMLTLPIIDHVITAVTKFSKNSFISQIDISWAFKHIPIDLGDIHNLRLHWNHYLVFGYIRGSDFYQRLSDSVRFIMAQEGYYILNYLDDHLIFGDKEKYLKGFDNLTSLLGELGLTINQANNVRPSKKVICLGILVDIANFTISLAEIKMVEIRKLVQNWKFNKSCSKKQVQSLLGSLLYITKCVRHSRLFLNRLLQNLRDYKVSFQSQCAFRDIQRHGTWTSDCVWHYVTDSVDCDPNVATTFATFFS